MKRITAILAALLIVCSVKGQNTKEPVAIQSESLVSGDTLTVVIDFKVENDWMVYDSLGGEVGPIPLSFTYDDLKGLELISIHKPKTKHKFDDIFEVDLWYFLKEAKYELKFKISDANAYSGSISAEYMSCNLTSGVCLPPQIFDYTISK
ncbi:MAG: hypothetical protein CMP61_09035 [Flavobacteriales bacterium]|nr:hypothetical protein [Flavobacteriales bacterium]|tara:strand:+ start:21570 stop:22019 length:450 start_codon:yes stop_codon:yes gene_type:complete